VVHSSGFLVTLGKGLSLPEASAARSIVAKKERTLTRGIANICRTWMST